VLLLTALGSVDERVAGLKAGADDYVVKPFAFPELLARLEAVHRRTADRPAAIMHVGPMTLDLATRRVDRAGQDIDLTPTEFSILEMLLRFSGQVVTRKMLCEHIWDAEWEGLTNVIEVHIKRLRDKLAAAGEADLIRTVRGRGYAARAL
jgi:two-component system OmpR family response regulator/two-component system copper resistance phosphate regulon response regulator CusR